MIRDLAAVLRGDIGAVDWREWSADEAVATASAEGVLPMVARALADRREAPAVLRSAFAAAQRAHVAAELVREHALRRLVRAFSSAGVTTLLIKGADLAYSAYPSPELRPRTDTDVLVTPEARAATTLVLRAQGYEAVPQSGGDLLMYQEPFRLLRDRSDTHIVDLHWRLFNPQLYGARLSFDDLDATAEARPLLAPGARGLNRVHALVLACVHRVAHHFDQPRLIWLFDVHLLAGQMSADDWRRFRDLVVTRQLQGPCARTLAAAREMFGSVIPDAVIGDLNVDTGGREDAAFLNPAAPHALRVLSDFRHVGSWRGRVRLARQHLFPPAAYMRDVYAPESSAPLWTLYVHRIVRGTRRWIARS